MSERKGGKRRAAHDAATSAGPTGAAGLAGAAGATLPVRELAAGGVEIDVVVQPRASRTGVTGLHDGRLRIAVMSAPVEGEANAALVAYVASALGIARREVTLVSGATGRRKTVRVSGVASGHIEGWVRASIEATQERHGGSV